MDKLERHNQLLEEVAWTQSHNFRGPLSKILGMVIALQNYGRFKKVKYSQEQILKEIESSAFELDKILRDLNHKLEEQNGKKR